MNLEHEVLKDKNLVELAATVKAHMQQGWKPKGKIVEYKGGFAMEMERPMEIRWRRTVGLRSWVAWPKFD
ncbi:hypothetical protein [Pontibacter mangrovi]|uniref:DUF1737 domain-containing protein n=1 Tax=Pontibacter mangrovi TaxID=2589816 RepID=A0A501W7C7_9BACT|nr:hypothetical protein [Pontibacter mangrovi]TPE44495.1 hypothetical protein FJM65_10170 [Pontibacter mangrovi]